MFSRTILVCTEANGEKVAEVAEDKMETEPSNPAIPEAPPGPVEPEKNVTDVFATNTYGLIESTKVRVDVLPKLFSRVACHLTCVLFHWYAEAKNR